MEDCGNTGNRIDFWRIIFTYMIVLLHIRGHFAWFLDSYHITKGWYLAVEFFFIVSGYLLAVSSRKEQSAYQYLKHRVVKLWPMYAASFAVIFIYINCLRDKCSLKQFIVQLIKSIDEIFMLQMVGLNMADSEFYNGQTWYISAMLLSGYVMFWLLKNYRKVTIELIIPFAVIIIYSYFFRTAGNLDVWRKTEGLWINHAFLRAFAGMGLGVLINKISTDRLGKGLSKGIYWLEVPGFICIIIIMLFCGGTTWDFILTPFMAFLIMLAFTHSSCWKGKEKSRKYCYSVYLNHWLIIKIMEDFFHMKDFPFYGLLIYVVLVALYSALFVMVTDFFCQRISRKRRGESG